MVVALNQEAFSHAKRLIRKGKLAKEGGWSTPSAETQDSFLAESGLEEYGKWHLGIDIEKPEGKERYEFPYGDFKRLNQAAVLDIEKKAAQEKYTDIETAASQIKKMLDGPQKKAKKE